MKIYLNILSKKFIIPLFALTVIFSFGISQVFAEYSDKIIVTENKEYEIGEITKEYKLSRKSMIVKTQGHTTTGEMFFLRISPFFEKVMILDRDDHWLKASLKEKQIEKIIEPIKTIIKEPKQKYIPELLMASSHDFRTYWSDTFNIDVQTYDGKINPKATGFEGRIDNANVTVILSNNDMHIVLSGVTTYGNWDGEYYVPANISMPGEYTIDVIVSYYNQTVSYSDSMFIIADTLNNDSSSNSTATDT